MSTIEKEICKNVKPKRSFVLNNSSLNQLLGRGIFPILLGFVALFIIACLISENFFSIDQFNERFAAGEYDQHHRRRYDLCYSDRRDRSFGWLNCCFCAVIVAPCKTCLRLSL